MKNSMESRSSVSIKRESNSLGFGPCLEKEEKTVMSQVLVWVLA